MTAEKDPHLDGLRHDLIVRQHIRARQRLRAAKARLRRLGLGR